MGAFFDGARGPGNDFSLEFAVPNIAFRHMGLTDVLGQDVHERLMDILDNAVIIGIHMQMHVRQCAAAPARKAGHGDGLDTLGFRP